MAQTHFPHEQISGHVSRLDPESAAIQLKEYVKGLGWDVFQSINTVMPHTWIMKGGFSRNDTIVSITAVTKDNSMVVTISGSERRELCDVIASHLGDIQWTEHEVVS